jgi:hypothetical protein
MKQAKIALSVGLVLLFSGCNTGPTGNNAAAPDGNPGAGDPGAGQALVNCTTVASRFGRMFPKLSQASWPADALDLLAGRVLAEQESDPTPEDEQDDEENTDIDAGFTYVGQFIDHDLTLDNRPNDLTTPTDPFTVPNLRTPTFDLDSVYGEGPSGSAAWYQADGIHFKLGAALGGSGDQGAVDLLRGANGQAQIGDARNDENRIVASLHSIVQRFHNRIADGLLRQHPTWSKEAVFKASQRSVQLHYQWAVLTDFLPTIVGEKTLREVLPDIFVRRQPPRVKFYDPCTMNMPVEFAVAAYRFGHSMVRALYRINSSVTERLPVFSLDNDASKNLAGFSPAPSNFAVDWKFFFSLDGGRKIGQPQASYKFDNSIVFPLGLLPLPATGSGPASLAKRNLLRSVQLGLPSGQQVARAMGLTPLRDDQILVGKATGAAEDATTLVSLSPSFAANAPLWSYILAEATASAYQVRNGQIVGGQLAPMRLGPVGGRIVAEVFVGLLLADRTSVLYSPFQPDPSFGPRGRFGFRELVQAVSK